MHFSVAALLAAAGLAAAQRPQNTSICDYYTTALLKDNTPANQYKLLTLLVNTVAIGNYTMPNVGIMVPGILAAGEYMGQSVNLMPYFNGGLASANRGMPTAVNFLDGGGATPLMNNELPTEGSNQYMLFTHLYSYFGALTGCTGYGEMGFPAYGGSNSQAGVHQYMDLTPAQVGYFIQQVGLAAMSFGVTKDDATAVGDSLNMVFGYKCSPAVGVIPDQDNATQAVCQDASCPQAPMGDCSLYDNNGMPMEPAVANATLAMGEGSNSTSGSSSMSSGMPMSSGMSMTASGTAMMTSSGMMSTPTSSGGAAKATVAGLGAAAVGGIAFAFAL